MDTYAHSLIAGIIYDQYRDKPTFYLAAFFRNIDQHLKTQATVLQPSLTGLSKCIAFVIFTSVQLEWITIPCNVSLAQVMVICQRDSNVSQTSHQHIQKTLRRPYWECEYGWVLIGSNCHRMINTYNSVVSNCYEALRICTGSFPYFKNSSVPLGKEHLKYFYYWLDSPYLQTFSVGAVIHGRETCLTGRLVEMVELSATYKQDLSVSHIAACATEVQHTGEFCISNQFQCEDGSCVLSHYMCDGVVDCPGGSDEEECSHVCTLSNTTQSVVDHPSICYYGCFPATCTCHPLYYHCEISGKCIPASRLCDDVRDCSAQEDELECGMVSKGMKKTSDIGVDMFRCSDGSFIPLERFNDLIPDCTGDVPADEEAYYLHLSANFRNSTVTATCSATSTLCVKDLPGPCYPRHKLCIYEQNRSTQHAMYCRNGAHLEDCSMHDCPGYYKCRWSYCIPYHYVCNHVLDCPWGEDEQNCSSLKCPGLLKCRLDNVCVHPHMIGDNVTDCPLSGDDEALDEITCPKTCKCLGDAVA